MLERAEKWALAEGHCGKSFTIVYEVGHESMNESINDGWMNK
jgi:hypothetical protein